MEHSESSCPGGSEYVWQRGVEGISGRVTGSWSLPYFPKKHRKNCECCPGHSSVSVSVSASVSQKSLKSLQKVSQKSPKSLSKVSLKSHKRLPKVSQKSLKSLSKVSQKSLKSFSKVFQKSLKRFSKVSQKSFKSRSIVFQKSLKSLSKVAQKIVSWPRQTDRQCQLLSCPGQLKICLWENNASQLIWSIAIQIQIQICCSYSAISRCDHFGKCWCYSRWIWKDRSCVTLIKLESKPWTLCFLWTIKLLDISNTKFQFLCLFELIAQFDVSTLIVSKAS